MMTKPFETLLVATDFSVTAGRACERAALLTAQHGARLIMQHSLPGQALKRLRARLWPGEAETEGRVQVYFESELSRQAEALAARWQIEVTPLLTVGQAHREITRAERENSVDLVVVGATGDNPVREFFLGSTAERVVREAVIPVLVVRASFADPYHRVLAPLDLSSQSPSVAQLARRIAPGALLTLAHAFEVPFDGKLQFAGVDDAVIQRFRHEERQAALDALGKLAQRLPGRPQIRVELRMPEAAIPALIQDTAAELVVVGKHGKSEVVDLLMGNMTQHVLREAHCDVLVAPAAEEASA